MLTSPRLLLRTICAGLLVSVAFAVQAASSTDTLVSYWKFDETSAGTFTDSSGDAYLGTGAGAGGTNNTPQPSTDVSDDLNISNTRSLHFDGTDDHVSIASGYADFTSGLTISVWAKPTATKTWGRFVDLGNGNDSDNIIFGRFSNTSSLFFETYSGATTVKVYGTGAITNDAWHHYLVTESSTGGVTIYADGSVVGVGQTNVPNNITRTSNYIGRSNWAGDQYYEGYMDDIRIYNRVLSETEISALANGMHTTATWDGSSSTDWETAANWDTGVVPDPYTLLVIPDTENDPKLSTAISGANLTIQNNAVFDLSGHGFDFNDGGGFYGSGTWAMIGNETIGTVRMSNNGTVLYYGTGSYSSFAAGDTYYHLAINDGLLAYLPLDETSGSSFSDVSGYGHTGSGQGISGANNTPPYTSTVAPTAFTNAGARAFDGTDDYIATDISPPSGAAARTITFWAKTPDIGNSSTSYALSYGGTAGSAGSTFRMGYGFGGAGCTIDVSSGLVRYTCDTTTGWHHYAYVVPAMNNPTVADVLIYQDGELLTSVASSISTTQAINTATTYPLTVGRYHEPGGGSPYEGEIDDIRVYSRPLQHHEIAALAAGHQPATGSGTFTMDSTLNISGDMILAAGTLDASASDRIAIIDGSWLNYGGKFTQRNGTVRLTSTDAATLQSGGQQFYKVLQVGSATYSLGDLLQTDNLLSVTNGVLDVTTNNYGIVAGDLYLGTTQFNPRNGLLTLSYSSNQSVTLDDTLYDLAIEDPTESNLVGHWKFDECQTNTATDLSGNNYDGTLIGPPLWSGANLASGIIFENPCALHFLGSNNAVSLPSGPLNTAATTGTISMWIKPDSASASQVLFWTEANRDRGIAMTGGEFSASMFDNGLGDFRYLTGGTITNNWQHLAFTWNISAGEMRLYQNGELVDSYSGSSWTNAANDTLTYIGQYGGGADSIYNDYDDFTGYIDDFRVYSTDLSAAQIANLASGYYADGDSGTATATAGGGITARTINILSGLLSPGSSTVSVTGDWNNYAGTNGLIAGTSTVDLAGSATQNIRGSSNFYNLEISTASAQSVLFGSGTTQAVSNQLTLTGQSSNLLTLGPLVASTTWYLDIDAGASQSVSYVSPSYSNASAGATINASNSTDGGNTTNWNFVATSNGAIGGGSGNNRRRTNVYTTGSSGGGDTVSSTTEEPEEVVTYDSSGYINDPSLRTQDIDESDLSRRVSQALEAIEGQFRSTTHTSAPEEEMPVPGGTTIDQRRGLLVAVIDRNEILYRDVRAEAWYAPYVAFVISQNIATGYKSEDGRLMGQFGVTSPVTYAEVLKMAMEVAGTPLAGSPPRNRTARNTWASPYVATAEELALPVIGSDVAVHSPATRAEVIRLVLEILGLPIANQDAQFADVPVSHPHARAIATAAFYGLISGDTAADGTPLHTFRPDASINRAEVAKIIALLQELQ